MPEFNDARVQQIFWENEHGTFKKGGVERILPIASTGDDAARWARVGAVLQEVVGYAFENEEPLRADGSRWSLSKIGVPDKLALSLAAHDVLVEIPTSWRTANYQSELRTSGLTPMLISGSMKIGRINRFLTMRDLALRTSGASDGQTLAGASTTGTHGAAIRFGAIHDSFRAIHLMVAPDKALLIQSSKKPLTATAAAKLTSWLGFETKLVTSDAQFHAAIVGLGSMGLVLNVVVEVEPLYSLTSVTTAITGDEWRMVLSRKDASFLAGHPVDPWHLEVLLTPYKQRPATAPRAWVKSMTKRLYQGEPDVDTDPSNPTRPSPDLIGVISHLADILDGPVTNLLFRKIITEQMTDRYGTGKKVRKALPGVMFGPTALPKGQGHSVEFVVDGGQALLAVETILETLAKELRRGRQFLGGIGVRFVGRSEATLAPNAKSPSCFIELPGIRTRESTRIFDACGRALHHAGVPFGCHWGQYLTRTKTSLNQYWLPASRIFWMAARNEILETETARRVFGSPILGPAGLD